MSKNNPWNDTYASTREANDGLEGNLLRAMTGDFISETPTGGTLRYGDEHLDHYETSNSEKGHSYFHYGSGNNGSFFHP